MRMTEWSKQFGLTVVKAEDRPDQWRFTSEQRSAPRRLEYVFTTRNGSWDMKGEPGEIEQWARDLFLFPPGDPRHNQQGGADRNLFGLLRDAKGNHLSGAGFYFWSDGLDKLNLPDAEFGKIATRVDAQPSGWANIEMYESSTYDPANNHGPWCWSTGYGDVLKGGGMPDRWHVTMFGVWQEQAGIVVVPPVTPPVEPPIGGELANILSYVQRIDANLESLMLHLGALGR